MIARASSSAEFGPLATYLTVARDTAPAHVAWIDSRNLVTPDPGLAADLMQATAAQNLRATDPVYHLILSFAPDDHPSPELVRQVADHTLTALGLAEHQALLVAHQDRAHAHVHLMVNRIHPVTLTAWDRWQDHAAVQQILYDQERALGLRQVTGRPDRSAADRAADNPTSSDRAATTRRAPLDKSFIERVCVHLPEIRSAQTWDDLRDRLAAHDLRLDRRANGLVITDGPATVPASSVAADLSLARLEARLGPHPRDQERATARTREHLEKTFDYHRERDAIISHLHRIECAVDRALRSATGLVRALAAVPTDPTSAKHAFDRAAADHGIETAAATLRDRPQSFGQLAVTTRARFLGLWRVTDDHTARVAATKLAPMARDSATYAEQARHTLALPRTASSEDLMAAHRAARASTYEAIRSIETAITSLPRAIPSVPAFARDRAGAPDRADRS
jgi:Relaxase/Mobilisation nuclease domain